MKKDLFAWRGSVASELGPTSPTTRHVLLTLSIYMNRNTLSCFPSIETISKATGLSKRSVCTHLTIAEDQGWINKIRLGKVGRGWKLNSYKALFPGEVVQEVQHVGVKDGEFHAEGGEFGHKNTEISKMKQPVKKTEKNGGKKDKVVKEVQTNQFNHLKNQNEEVKEVHYQNKEADLDSKKESDPLHELYTPSHEEFAECKSDCKRKGAIGRDKNTNTA